MNLLPDTFQFLRPEWFWALVPALLLYLVLRARHARGSNWERTIDASLLPFLLDSSSARGGRNPMVLLFIAWILATVALAGPVWRKNPQPVHEREDAVVIIFDLTRSMYAEDVRPNRLVRARRKLQDLLATRDEGVTGLVVFSGDAHTVTPLTDDAATISEMIPAISPEIMPASGSQLAPALELAIQLFRDAGVASGRILIITDEIRDIAESQVIAREHRFSYPISVLAVGTREGAPIPGASFSADGGYLKDQNGTMIIPKVDLASLQSFASVAGGRFSPMTLTDEDLDYLLAEQVMPGQEQFRELERDFDVWIEEGPWLLLLLLPLATLAFRRGWVWSLAVCLILPSERADASWWEDAWFTRDQQGIEAMQKGDVATAAELFENPAWKAAAQYRSEDFDGAAEQFGNLNSNDARFNFGNTLAKLGKYEEAIDAYEQVLAANPDDDDARFNKQLIEDLLKNQQKQQQDPQNSDQQDQDQKDQEQQQSQGDEQNEQQQAGDEQQQDQQAEDEKEQNAENQEQQDSEEKQGEQQEMAEAEAEPLDEEQRQALEQWLRRVPDDPGGLLRRKFELQHAERQNQGNQKNNGDNY